MRLQRIESFRVYSILLIVFGHSQFEIKMADASWLADVLKVCICTIPRFTMPFFFILSGYFVGGKMLAQEAGKAVSVARQYTQRMSVYYLFWWIFYLFEKPMRDGDFTYGILRPAYWTLLKLYKDDPFKCIMVGPRVHLWFLTAMVITIWVFMVLILLNKTKFFLALGIILYIFGLLCGPYKFMPLGLDAHSNPACYALFSILFFAIGVYFYKNLPRFSNKAATGLVVFGLIVYCLEVYFVWENWALSPVSNDFLVGTIPFGVGVFLLAFKQSESSLDKIIGPYGRYMLGVFLCQYIFIDLFAPLARYFPTVAWQFILPLSSFACSLLSTIAYYNYSDLFQRNILSVLSRILLPYGHR